MPDRKHHSEKWHSCWEQVQAKGWSSERAAAICTAQLGDESFAAAEEHPFERELHVLAKGSCRVEQYEGREHLVVPLVALMEGVIHAVNAPEPEFVPEDVLSAMGWDGRPVVLGHPTNNGRQISANDPKVLEKHRIGTVFQARKNGKLLGMEAWLDPQRLEALGQKALLEDCRAGKSIEVSVGAFVRTELRNGEYKGKKYRTAWRNVSPDHLAFLPNTKGACSIEMGCGTFRSAHVYDPQECEYTLYHLEGVEPEVVGEPSESLRIAVGRRNNSIDQQMIQTMHDNSVALGAMCGEPKVMQEWLLPNAKIDFKALKPMPDKSEVVRNGSPRYKDCPHCDGLGQMDGKDCPVCEGEGKIRVAQWFEEEDQQDFTFETVN